MDQNIGKFEAWYEKRYKFLILIPLFIMVISIVYLISFNAKHGDFIYKDSSLAGGTTITLTGINITADNLEKDLQIDFPDVSVREIKDIASDRLIALIIDTTADADIIKDKVEKVIGEELTDKNASIEFTGSSLSDSFFRQLILAIMISFLLISIVVFLLFRKVFRSIATIIAVLGNIVMPLALINLFGVKLSSAGIAAFLMIIGYSVDNDILLTSRVLKRNSGSINQRISGAFKTGMFITGTALIALLPAFFIVTGLPDSFRQIFLILSLGLVADMINTWMFNAGILKWSEERRLK